MTSLISCPGCKHQLALPAEFEGRRVQCPRCGVEFDGLASLVPAMEVAADDEVLEVKPAPDPVDTEPLPTAQPAPPLETAYASARKPQGRATAVDEAPAVYCSRCGTKSTGVETVCLACGLRLQELFVDPRRRPFRRLTPIRGLLAVFGAILIPVGAAILIGGFVLVEALRFSPPGVRFWIPFLCFSFGVVIELTAIGVSLTWLYQAWRAVLGRDEDDSPELMVGVLAVPFFNLYWMFRAVPGLSVAIHDELKRLVPTREPSTGWYPGLAACVLVLIPFPPFWAIGVCMFLAWMLIANNAIHRLIRLNRVREADLEQHDAMER